MHLKNGKKLYNERWITFFHETERYVNNLNIYNRSKNGTNLWDNLIDLLIINYTITSINIFVENYLNFCVTYRNVRFTIPRSTNFLLLSVFYITD